MQELTLMSFLKSTVSCALSSDVKLGDSDSEVVAIDGLGTASELDSSAADDVQ